MERKAQLAAGYCSGLRVGLQAFEQGGLQAEWCRTGALLRTQRAPHGNNFENHPLATHSTGWGRRKARVIPLTLAMMKVHGNRGSRDLC